MHEDRSEAGLATKGVRMIATFLDGHSSLVTAGLILIAVVLILVVWKLLALILSKF